jgi:Spy/CpxP family protein refolding chaperone
MAVSGAHGVWPSVVLAVLLGPYQGTRADQIEGPEPARAATPAHAAPRPRLPFHADRLEQRLQLLTRELKLTPTQQHQVREILLNQRETVSRIWTNPQITPAERAPAVRAITGDTADRIRAILTPEQRDKYSKALPKGQIAAESKPDVQGWLDAVRGEMDTSPLGVPLPTDAVPATSPAN